ncbi:peptidyl-prolyl cis-trans isomerase B (cyclophilin B) [Roseivirga pacifica]|uniref:peptidylprolyl isomerase n=1 Tax=Roseivirga pacifica TaxID=1267423 RepID=A0A1I0NDY0_9BACT|nr:peptidylprolyl isomerase [Roseivirga pacifica]RKQ51110.1 peptidyl-prolyl cis-trans isomerase B (cyclophilin B) [Roseivirga pacifica]SEV99306.1 peptidyl-prolyl cis-trans isomerase B (cyclophilin B) [Roseivirga pacifica]
MSTLKHFLLLFLLAFMAFSCAETDEIVVIETPYGDMTAILYDDTPIHKANFLKLAKEGKYDSVLFHRVIEEFMIQTGDLSTGTEEKGANYRLEAEFRPERYIHKKGGIAAARMGDASNPLKESSGSQFYIIHGKTFDEEGLLERADRRQYLKLYGFFERMLKSKRYPELTEKYYYHVGQLEEDSTYDFNKAQKELIFNSLPVIEKRFGPQPDPGFEQWAKDIYATDGGAPHLDGEYTVFGQVLEGIEVIDEIATTETDARDRPTSEIRMNVRVVKMKKSEIEQKYGYQYPQQ